MYNLNQLSTFVKVAELGSFNKVAEEEFISPNAVMMQINNLEAELGGTKLLIRSKKGNKLTHAGELLYKDAKKILGFCSESKRLIMKAADTENCTIRVAVTYGSSFMLFEKLWKEVHRRYPEMRIEMMPMIYDAKADKALWSSFNDWTDVFLCYLDEKQAIEGEITEYGNLELSGIMIDKVPLYCMVDCNHRLAEYDSVRLDDLEGERVAILSEGWGENAGKLRQVIEEKHQDINLEVRPFFSADTYNECANERLVIVGGFDTIAVHPFISAIPIKEDEDIDNVIGLVYANPPSAQIEKFVSAVKEIINDNPDIVKVF